MALKSDQLRLGAERKLCVVVHDVAGVFRDELTEIVARIKPLVGNRFSCGVVPCWHEKTDRRMLQNVVDVCCDCDEWLVHGWTHFKRNGLGLTSWLTRNSDEFSGLNSAQVKQRIFQARLQIEDVTGAKPAGLVAPCWKLPIPPTELEDLDYVMGYQNFYPVADADHAAVLKLASWSYDWGRFRSAARIANLWPNLQLWRRPETVTCVVLHPMDVQTGWLNSAVERIQWLLRNRYQPVCPKDLLANVPVANVQVANVQVADIQLKDIQVVPG